MASEVKVMIIDCARARIGDMGVFADGRVVAMMSTGLTTTPGFVALQSL